MLHRRDGQSGGPDRPRKIIKNRSKTQSQWIRLFVYVAMLATVDALCGGKYKRQRFYWG